MIDPSAQPLPPREYLASFGDWDDLGAALLVILQEGRAPKPYRVSQDTSIRFKLGLLQWMVSRQPDAEIQWQALEGREIPPATAERYGLEPREGLMVPDRDAYVERFWRSTARDCPNEDVRLWLSDRWGALASYQEHLFGWFIRRFNPGVALRLAVPSLGRSANLLPWLFPIVAVAASMIALGRPAEPVFAGALWALGAVLLVLAILCYVLEPRPAAVVELFVPRLAATVAIGYLFLAAAPELIALLVIWGGRVVLQIGLSTGIVLAVLLYVMHHISRRVTPRPQGRPLLLRAATVTAIAVGHAAVGLAVFAPLLFSPEFLEFVQPGLHHPPGAHQLVLCGAIALAVGVILELAWEEKPLTEPL